MLILSRREGEAVLIDGGIRVVVLATDGRTVRLGIEAPSHIGIVREEIVLEIAEENRRATAGGNAQHWLAQIPLQKRRAGSGAGESAADHADDASGARKGAAAAVGAAQD